MFDVSASTSETEATCGEMNLPVEGQRYMIGSGMSAQEGERRVGECNVKDIWSVQSALRKVK